MSASEQSVALLCPAGASLKWPNVEIVERSTDKAQVDLSYRLEPGQKYGVYVRTYYNSWQDLEVAVTLEWGNKHPRRRALMERSASALPRRALSQQTASV